MAIILAKNRVSRKETLQYANKKFNWDKNVIIGVSAWFGFWAWVWGRLTKRKVIYYCIDFYSPEIAKNLWDRIFIWSAMQMDKFLIRVVDKVWDISERINEGRVEFGHYSPIASKTHFIVPLTYPPHYLRNLPLQTPQKGVFKVVYVGLDPYGVELVKDYPSFVWLGNPKFLPLKILLEELSSCAIGISLWKEWGNNYYGDPGKTKLYSACGLPVIMTSNTPYARIIELTQAGIVVDYDKRQVDKAITKILCNYDFYKNNVKKTWQYINADYIFRDKKLLE